MCYNFREGNNRAGGNLQKLSIFFLKSHWCSTDYLSPHEEEHFRISVEPEKVPLQVSVYKNYRSEVFVIVSVHTVCDWNAYSGGFLSYACYNALIVGEFLYGNQP